VLKVKQKLAYLVIATAPFLSNVNGSDGHRVIERNCHECPFSGDIVKGLNDMPIERKGGEYELPAFIDYPIKGLYGKFVIKDVYEEPCFSNLGGFLRNWSLYGLFPFPHTPTLKPTTLQQSDFKLHETKKDNNGTVTCLFIHTDHVSGVKTYFEMQKSEPKVP
jgi:hypothetical protein